MKATASWTWGASGKHPVVKDFISIGQSSPPMAAMSRWIEEGYPRVTGKAIQHSWRFFFRGPGSGELSCGIVRDSFDGAGRPFPLLIMGSGVLAGWERVWEFIPLALDDIWVRLEYLSARRFFDLSEFKGDVERLPKPSLPEEGLNHGHSGGETLPAGHAGMTAVPLKGEGGHAGETVGLLLGTRDRHHPMPAAVFMGGTVSRSFLVVFARGLTTEDFVTIWSME